jgi:hypothetical protein
MEISKWQRRRFIPTWGDNDQEDIPCVIIFRPPNVGWMARWRELTLSSPQLNIEEGQIEESVKKIRQWAESIDAFRTEFLSDLIVAVEGLTRDDKAMTLDESLEFIQENEGLREEVFFALIAEGGLKKEQGKD